MDDLISRAAAIKTILDLCPETTIQGSYDEYAVSCLCGASELLKQLPAVDAALVVHGEWKWSNGGQCSECGFHNSNFDYNFCPNCGARMDGD